MASRRLIALVISADRLAIRGLSRFLQAFGYQVNEAADAEQAFTAIAWQSPDFIILDGEPVLHRLAELLARIDERRSEVYTFSMAGTLDAIQLTEALKVGVDDFLSKPVVFGELLARLRAGARVLEHRRRWRQQDRTDPVTDLPSRSAFCKNLQDALHNADGQSAPVVCVAFELDYYEQIEKQHGQPLAWRGLKSLADTLARRLEDSASLACGAGGQFFATLIGASETQGAQWAERLRTLVAAETFPLGEVSLGVTASVGIAANDTAGVDARELLQRSLEAQKLARESGRDCVAVHSQLNDQARSWASLATPGRLFESTLARDVMIPCALVLRRDETLDHARSQVRKPSLAVIPVVDNAGSFVGYLTEKAIVEAQPGQLAVHDLTIADAPCVDETASFAHLIDFFTHDCRSLLFVTSNGRPVGLVTRSSLTALSEPVESGTFYAELPHLPVSEHLSVCDTSLCCES